MTAEACGESSPYRRPAAAIVAWANSVNVAVSDNSPEVRVEYQIWPASPKALPPSAIANR